MQIAARHGHMARQKPECGFHMYSFTGFDKSIQCSWLRPAGCALNCSSSSPTRRQFWLFCLIAFDLLHSLVLDGYFYQLYATTHSCSSWSTCCTHTRTLTLPRGIILPAARNLPHPLQPAACRAACRAACAPPRVLRPAASPACDQNSPNAPSSA